MSWGPPNLGMNPGSAFCSLLALSLWFSSSSSPWRELEYIAEITLDDLESFVAFILHLIKPSSFSLRSLTGICSFNFTQASGESWKCLGVCELREQNSPPPQSLPFSRTSSVVLFTAGTPGGTGRWREPIMNSQTWLLNTPSHTPSHANSPGGDLSPTPLSSFSLPTSLSLSF